MNVNINQDVVLHSLMEQFYLSLVFYHHNITLVFHENNIIFYLFVISWKVLVFLKVQLKIKNNKTDLGQLEN